MGTCSRLHFKGARIKEPQGKSEDLFTFIYLFILEKHPFSETNAYFLKVSGLSRAKKKLPRVSLGPINARMG